MLFKTKRSFHTSFQIVFSSFHFTFFTPSINYILCKLLIVFNCKRKVTVTTTSLNIKTTYLIWNTIFLMSQRNNTFIVNTIFVCTSCSFHTLLMLKCLFPRKSNPSRWTYISNMKHSK